MAPRVLRNSPCTNDDVVIMGEKPLRRAIWIATREFLMSIGNNTLIAFLTVLTDGRRPSDDEGGFSRVFHFTSFFPRSSEAYRQLRGRNMAPHPSNDCCHSERDSRRPIEGDVIRNLCDSVSESVGVEGERRYTHLRRVLRGTDTKLLEGRTDRVETCREQPVAGNSQRTAMKDEGGDLHSIALGEVLYLCAYFFDKASAIQTSDERIFGYQPLCAVFLYLPVSRIEGDSDDLDEDVLGTNRIDRVVADQLPRSAFTWDY